MIRRYDVNKDGLHYSWEEGKYCLYSDVEQLEKDHAEELTIATLLGYDKAKDKIKKLEEQNKQLLDALKLYYDHCKNNHQINSINETAKKLLEDYNV